MKLIKKWVNIEVFVYHVIKWKEGHLSHLISL